ncbi:MAG: NAD-dependent epimerase/dehydratase family protein [Tannerellaceae bacterium]|nr:NAD-dependent epimerase/dehydratase family protein [Tannerellaceae bacterium]
MEEIKIGITGVSGLVGNYLAEYLLNKGLAITGFSRKELKDINIIYGDITDKSSLVPFIKILIYVFIWLHR